MTMSVLFGRFLCRVAACACISLFLVGAASAQEVARDPTKTEVVRIRLDLVPPDLQGDIDTCAIDREADGLYPVFFLSEERAAGLSVPHERLGKLSDYLLQFLPVNTLRDKDIPSLTGPLGLPAGGSGGTGVPRDETTLTYDRYHNRAEGIAFMRTIAAAFPNIVQMVSLGQALGGRDIWALKITDNPTVVEPGEERILFTGVTHAREWATHEMMLYLAEYLTNRYPADPQVRRIVDNSVVWLVPVVNPDGFDYTWTNDRMWRKNRKFISGTCYGVDINRNYAYGWGGPGASTNPCDETYRGQSAASEIETQAMQNLLSAQTPAIGVSFHTYSQLLLFAWGSTTQVTPESYTSLRAIGKKYADLVQQVHGTVYLPGQGSYTIYVTSGDFDDQAYGANGALAFTPEMRPRSYAEGGFALPENQILPNNEESMAAALWLMLNVANAASANNPNSPTLIESPALGANMFSLGLTPVNQKPTTALGFDPANAAQLRAWLDDNLHVPPFWGTFQTNYEGCGTGGGYILDNNTATQQWASGLTSYKVLPYVFEDGAEIMLSNKAAGMNLIGVPSDQPVLMQDISVIKRVLAFSGSNYGYYEVIQASRTALQDLNNVQPWINWNWRYTDVGGVDHYSHPTGAGGADLYVQPYRAYYITVNLPSWNFGSTSSPVYLLQFPAVNRDCNYNGVPDVQDIAQGASLDCDGDGRPDECEYPGCAGITLGDFDCNGLLDGRDIQGFVDYFVGWRYACQGDLNQDGVIDANDVPLFAAALLGS
jgi:carboxypeptidase T